MQRYNKYCYNLKYLNARKAWQQISNPSKFSIAKVVIWKTLTFTAEDKVVTMTSLRASWCFGGKLLVFFDGYFKICFITTIKIVRGCCSGDHIFAQWSSPNVASEKLGELNKLLLPRFIPNHQISGVIEINLLVFAQY